MFSVCEKSHTSHWNRVCWSLLPFEEIKSLERDSGLLLSRRVDVGWPRMEVLLGILSMELVFGFGGLEGTEEVATEDLLIQENFEIQVLDQLEKGVVSE